MKMVVRIKVDGVVLEELGDAVPAYVLIEELRRLQAEFPDSDVGFELGEEP